MLRTGNISSSGMLCEQYTGLDIQSICVRFFEARKSPETAPLVLWLNGGPGIVLTLVVFHWPDGSVGCSSTTGLLFELGPCRISDEGYNTTYNQYSWNNDVNIIFLDQPVGVGYSYSDDRSTVDSTPVAAIDVYAFLELFLSRFKEYASAPFHIAAESYGGTYAPNFANFIYHKNKQLQLYSSTGLIKINLASVILGNGHTDPYIQFASIPKFACEGPYPIYDDPNGRECNALRSKVPICQRLVKACYDYGSRIACAPAGYYCGLQLWATADRGYLLGELRFSSCTCANNSTSFRIRRREPLRRPQEMWWEKEQRLLQGKGMARDMVESWVDQEGSRRQSFSQIWVLQW